VWAEKEASLQAHYGDQLWKSECVGECPGELATALVVSAKNVIANGTSECSLIISAIAPRLGFLEDELRDAGFLVVSISPYKRQENPLCVLEANAPVLERALVQSMGEPRAKRPLVKSPNCVCCGTSVVLRALSCAFGPLKEVSVTTMQSLSGRGDAKYPAHLVVGNVYPLHGTQEHTEALIQEELITVLGDAVGALSVTAYRVSVQRGHLVDVRVKLRDGNISTPEQVYAALESFDPLADVRKHLPSVPANPIVVERAGGCPRSADHHSANGGLSITAGNIKVNNGPYDICLSLVVDNLKKGALSAALQLLEYTVHVEKSKQQAQTNITNKPKRKPSTDAAQRKRSIPERILTHPIRTMKLVNKNYSIF
jgi:aspartate-semialdehyde dehydrogenase